MMSSEGQWDLIINSLALGVGLIGLVGIWLNKADGVNAAHRRALSCLIALLSTGCLILVLQTAGALAKTGPVLVGSIMTMVPLPAVTWLYIVRLTSPPNATARIKRSHWITTIVGGLLVLPLLAAPELASEAELADEVVTSDRVLTALACFALFLLLWFAHLGRVGLLTVRRLRSYRAQIQDVVADTDGLELRWIDALMIFIAGSIALLLIDLVSTFILPEPLLGSIMGHVFALGVIAGLVIFGLRQTSSGHALQLYPPPVQDGAPPQNAPASYDRSSFSEQDCKLLAFQLDALMSSEKPWLDPFLDLKTMSRMVGSKPYYVTQALNTVLEKNFYGYVNGWRVAEAARLLLETDESVLAISELSGFNSKSTFNATFRKETGVTPSAYRREKMALVAA